jgi:hypothetical protein
LHRNKGALAGGSTEAGEASSPRRGTQLLPTEEDFSPQLYLATFYKVCMGQLNSMQN